MAKITVFAEIMSASENVPFWVPKWSQNGGWRRPRASKDGSEEAPKRKNIFSEKLIFERKSGKQKGRQKGPKRSYKGEWVFPSLLQACEAGPRGRVGKG